METNILFYIRIIYGIYLSYIVVFRERGGGITWGYHVFGFGNVTLRVKIERGLVVGSFRA